MFFTFRKQKRLISLLMVVFFLGATLGAQAGGGLFGAKSGSKTTSTSAKGTSTSVFSGLAPKNILITAAAAAGTDLAIKLIKGQRVSLKSSLATVTSAEFGGSVAGSVLGAAGGQVAATVVKSIIPGPIGAIAGALLPVMTSTLGAQMGGSYATS